MKTTSYFVALDTTFDTIFNTSPQKQPKGRTEQENYSRDSKRGKHKPDFSSQRKQKRGE